VEGRKVIAIEVRMFQQALVLHRGLPASGHVLPSLYVFKTQVQLDCDRSMADLSLVTSTW
jgi:hypothetical protein